MKLESLTVLRAIAIIGVLLGHTCLQLGLEPMGRFWGYLSVQVFFLLSAFLLGLKYSEAPLSLIFLLGRWKRLSYVYYPFLAISIVALFIMGIYPSWSSIIAHFFYYNYPFQLDLGGFGFGHLWYISMLMCCYLLVQVSCSKYFFNLTTHLLHDKVGIIIYLLITWGVGCACTHYGIPSRIPIVLSTFLLFFVNAKRIFEISQKFQPKSAIAAFVILNALCLCLFFFNDLNNKLIARDTIVLLASLSWLALFLIPLRVYRFCAIWYWISAMSFEIYLVHSPFILGEFCWYNSEMPFSKGVFIWLLAMGITLLLSYLLHVVCGFLYSKVKNR